MRFGIAGQARMGKDALGAALCRLDSELTRVAFADAVKKIVTETFGVDRNFVEEWKVKPENPPGFQMPMRKILQFVGDGFRTSRPTVWIHRALSAHPANGVCCDVRYFNEVAALKSRGVVCVLIGRSLNLSDDPNPSEAELRPLIQWFLDNTSDKLVPVNVTEMVDAPPEAAMFDWFVRNEGSLLDLHACARGILDGHPYV